MSIQKAPNIHYIEGWEYELSLRGIIYDDEWGTTPGITTPHTLTTYEDHLHQDSGIS